MHVRHSIAVAAQSLQAVVEAVDEVKRRQRSVEGVTELNKAAEGGRRGTAEAARARKFRKCQCEKSRNESGNTRKLQPAAATTADPQNSQNGLTRGDTQGYVILYWC